MESLFDMLGADYHWVLLTVVYTIIMVAFLAIKVGRARKKHGVSYPTMYSDKDKLFNCVQRAHQNTLEQVPVFLCLLLLVGIELPRFEILFFWFFLLLNIWENLKPSLTVYLYFCFFKAFLLFLFDIFFF